MLLYEHLDPPLLCRKRRLVWIPGTLSDFIYRTKNSTLGTKDYLRLRNRRRAGPPVDLGLRRAWELEKGRKSDGGWESSHESFDID